MTDRTRVTIGRTMAALAVVAAFVGLGWALARGLGGQLWGEWIVHNFIVAVGCGAIVWLVIGSQPRNAAIWVLAWTSFFTGFEVLGYAAASHWAIELELTESIMDLVPAELPTGLALLLMQVNWLWIGVLMLLAVLSLFPDGKAASPRWRWLPPTMLAVVALASFGMFWEARPSGIYTYYETQDTHGGFRSLTSSFVTLGYPLTFLLGVVALVALVGRYRRSVGEERQQFRWVAWGASVAGILMLAALLFDELAGLLNVSLVVGALGMIALIGSIGVAIGKYRLYDIDVVISRTLVYGTLAVFIGLVYMAIAALPWIILGSEASNNTWLGIMATVVVAVSFQPLRRRLEKWANKVVYGRQATPYEVLSSFSQGISAVDPDVLSQVARSLSEGTTAQSASIWVFQADEMHCIAAWPEMPGSLPIGGVTSIVAHDGDELGVVALQLPPGQPFPVTDRRLLDQVASGLGLAIRNLRLTDDLRTRVEELGASRRRIVAVQDETRRKLERDLHDGAQQRLVALKIKLGIASSMAEKAGLDDVRGVIDTVRQETDQTIDAVRDFARGIYPPLLEAEGLPSALSAIARKMPMPVNVQAAGLGRYSKEHESTVYFCVMEALQNAMKHSEASSIHVLLEDRSGLLTFEVRDDGVGFDPTRIAPNGLINMRDRVRAMGGELEVDSSPGRGTIVSGTLTAKRLVPA